MLDEVFALENIVKSENACALPGCTIKFDSFVRVLRRAMSRGYVHDVYGNYVLEGLQFGFDLGVDMDVLKASLVKPRVFSNYKSALDARPQVSEAVRARVQKHKSIKLGAWSAVRDELNALGMLYICFPQSRGTS